MKIKNRERLLAIAAIAVVALFAGDRLVLSPLIRSWQDRAQRIADLTKSLNRGKVVLDREPSIRSRWAYMKTNALPADASVAQDEVMKAVFRWSEKSELQLTSAKPAKKDGEDYTTIECHADGNGNIDAVKKFLYELESDPLALKVEDVQITARDNEGLQLSVAVRISGLILSTEER